MNLSDIVFQCYDAGFYTYATVQYVLETPVIISPELDAPLSELCTQILSIIGA